MCIGIISSCVTHRHPLNSHIRMHQWGQDSIQNFSLESDQANPSMCTLESFVSVVSSGRHVRQTKNISDCRRVQTNRGKEPDVFFFSVESTWNFFVYRKYDYDINSFHVVCVPFNSTKQKPVFTVQMMYYFAHT